MNGVYSFVTGSNSPETNGIINELRIELPLRKIQHFQPVPPKSHENSIYVVSLLESISLCLPDEAGQCQPRSMF